MLLKKLVFMCVLIFPMIFILGCEKNQEIKDDYGYLGKDIEYVVKLKGQPKETYGEKDFFMKYGYMENKRNYMIFTFSKNNRCMTVDETLPMEMYDEKIAVLQKAFGEPTKVENTRVLYGGLYTVIKGEEWQKEGNTFTILGSTGEMEKLIKEKLKKLGEEEKKG